ncbi:MAG TPA: response regulator [Dongiaceae bacterium]|nr:response regulator [Dongiaceae bacterium]
MSDYPVTPAGVRMGEPPPHQPDLTRHVLVAEDDEDICQLNAQVLVQLGCRVDTAADGAAAWAALQRTRYDLLVTDNNMPKMTGVELLHKLHAARLAVPVIMATGILPREEFDRSPWIKPAAVLLKPYTITELLRAVQAAMRLTAPETSGQSQTNADRPPLRGDATASEPANPLPPVPPPATDGQANV